MCETLFSGLQYIVHLGYGTRRYDIKGSWVGRRTKNQDPTVALKDLNFKEDRVVINLGDGRSAFLAQIGRDVPPERRCVWQRSDRL